jgi:hypothetical protein
MRRVMAYMYEACRRNWLPIGVAPNIEVSLVVTSDDAALLPEAGAGWLVYEAWRRAVKHLAAPVFRYRLRPRQARRELAVGASGRQGAAPPC